jgi:hypothetical protein|tara:strand:+ start:107 stop:1033 length:927 start_codon:yes stop_codon:yes gene_type:complete
MGQSNREATILSSEKARVPERAPLLTLILTCTILAIWNYNRGLNLWAGYNLGGAVMALMALTFLWSGRMRIPAFPLWIGYATTLLHFVGGSLGAADSGPGPFCFEGMQPGEWLCADGVNGMYHVHPWWDKVVHGMNSASAAIAWSFAWRRVSDHNGWEISSRMIAGICFSLTVAIGMGYEVYEFFGKVFFYTIDQGGYTNTVTDLISNSLGAASGVAFAFYCDPLNAKAPSVGTTPLPWQASLTLTGTLPLTIVAILLSLDMILLSGMMVGSDYDRVGEVLLASVLISSLLVTARLAQQSQMKKQEAE